MRSFRQGATVEACDMKMPEEFVRASGGWKSDAMYVYRKERLPGLQEVFAKNLSKRAVIHSTRELVGSK